ncbi:MAG TPA: 2Fe-2S iron-sulfur cluster-binding protein [Anaerolineae bacterium]|nr:2Fe-2S iron-sulfur cluster-binding protein [Anaerolineae bacterium]
MAKITVNGQTFEVADGTRLVNAIEGNGIDILHRCGGHAKCTTCRVTFNAGEPNNYNEAEKAKLEANGNLGEFRLSCQILCAGEMDVNVINRLSETDLSDAGPEVADKIGD